MTVLLALKTPQASLIAGFFMPVTPVGLFYLRITMDQPIDAQQQQIPGAEQSAAPAKCIKIYVSADGQLSASVCEEAPPPDAQPIQAEEIEQLISQMVGADEEAAYQEAYSGPMEGE